MDKSAAIEVDNISKRFKVYLDKGTSLKEKILFGKRRFYEERNVLQDISFTVRQGESIGLIGENGCGKSTMLKILTKIMFPDNGSVKTNGRISALIELGAGFHPDMSGRENIYTNAAIFGLTKREIDDRLQTIIDFSELHEYIDNPVRTYSSGMYMRLAFSVAINVDADILLIDEILAVGDASFQAKCFNKLREIKAGGTTIVIVSHSLGQIEQFCDRSIWICDGRIQADGKPRDVHPQYLDYMGKQREEFNAMEQNAMPSQNEEKKSNSEPAEKQEGSNRWGNRAVQINSIRLLDKNGEEREYFSTGASMEIEICYKVNGELNKPSCGIGVFRNDGIQCFGTNTQIDHLSAMELGESGVISCQIIKNQLLPGEYSLDVALHTEDGFAYDYYRFAAKFHMYSDVQDMGIMRLEHQWNIQPMERNVP